MKMVTAAAMACAAFASSWATLLVDDMGCDAERPHLRRQIVGQS